MAYFYQDFHVWNPGVTNKLWGGLIYFAILHVFYGALWKLPQEKHFQQNPVWTMWQKHCSTTLKSEKDNEWPMKMYGDLHCSIHKLFFTDNQILFLCLTWPSKDLSFILGTSTATKFVWKLKWGRDVSRSHIHWTATSITLWKEIQMEIHCVNIKNYDSLCIRT